MSYELREQVSTLLDTTKGQDSGVVSKAVFTALSAYLHQAAYDQAVAFLQAQPRREDELRASLEAQQAEQQRLRRDLTVSQKETTRVTLELQNSDLARDAAEHRLLQAQADLVLARATVATRDAEVARLRDVVRALETRHEHDDLFA